MKLAPVFLITCVMFCSSFFSVYAEDLTSLPTIQMMADDELRDEVLTTVQPFQEDRKVRKALQHQIIKKEQELQNYEIGNQANLLNIQPQTTIPDLSQLSPLQREYVLSVASSLQSADPSSGIFKMLEPLGIDRDRALNNVRNGGGVLQINFDEQRLTQLLGDKWQSGLKGN